jgi:hypothetical protein
MWCSICELDDPNDRLATGALRGALLPVLGVAVIVAFNAFYWLPIRGESPGRRS